MFRLARSVLTMSKPLAGVNSPAVVFGNFFPPVVSPTGGVVGSWPGNAPGHASEPTISVIAKAAGAVIPRAARFVIAHRRSSESALIIRDPVKDIVSEYREYTGIGGERIRRWEYAPAVLSAIGAVGNAVSAGTWGMTRAPGARRAEVLCRRTPAQA